MEMKNDGCGSWFDGKCLERISVDCDRRKVRVATFAALFAG